MADPMNPAGGPPTGGSGGGNKSPVDPGMADVMQKLEGFINDVNLRLDSQDEKMHKVLSTSEKVTDELKKQVKEADEIQATYKKTVELGKKLQAQDLKKLHDSKEARKVIQEMTKLHEGALKNAKAGSKEAQVMGRNLSDMRKLLKDIGSQAQLNETQFSKLRDIIGETARNAQDLVKAMYNLSRTGAALKGMTGILGAMGVGRGMSRNIERRMEQVQEVKDKITEARDMRKVATVKHMQKKREKSIEQMRTEQAKGGKHGGLRVDPETGEVMQMFDEKGGLTKIGRGTLAEKMGFTRGTKKFNQFIGGEAAIGAGGQAGAGYTAAMGEGGGAIEAAMGGLEEGLMGLMAVAPEIIIPLELLAAAITALTDAFDNYAKQNQEMEKNLGKAGLFTQPGIGGGEAFARARNALMPRAGGQGLALGMTFERNVELAGAMANAGFAPRPGQEGLGNQANLAPGAQNEFMQGSMGEAQRVVMGVSRVGGLTDAEGTENLIKLLETYHETMASAEMFMTRINKDTQAAGISTTKYLKIIDEVNGAFDKMGKSLEQVTGIMRELTRYGGISSETLKDLMEGLLNSGAKPGMGDAALSGYAQSLLQGSQLLQGNRDVARKTLDNYMNNLNVEAARAGIQGVDKETINDLISKKDYTGARAKANEMRGRLLQMPDSQAKQSMEGALQNILGQIPHIATIMSGSAMGRTFGFGATGKGPADQLTENLRLLQDISAKSGVSMSDIFAGGGNDQAKGIITALNEMFKQAGMKNLGEMADVIATQRVQDVRVMPTDTAAGKADQAGAAKSLVNELYRASKTNKPIGTWVKDNLGLGKVMKAQGVDTLDALLQTKDGMDATLTALDGQADTLGTSDESLKKLQMSMADGNDTSDAALAHNLDQARDVGSRTQKVEDILKNIFAPLLASITEAVEFIATAISKLPIFGGNFQADQARSKNDFAAIPKAVDKLTASNVELTKQRDPLQAKKDAGTLSPDEQKTYDNLTQQIKGNVKTIDQLNDVLVQKTFVSKGQMDNVEKALTNIGQGKQANMPDMPSDVGPQSHPFLRTGAALATGGLSEIIKGLYGSFEQKTGGGDIYNTYFSSDSTMNNVAPSGGNTSTGESAQNPKPPVARTNR